MIVELRDIELRIPKTLRTSPLSISKALSPPMVPQHDGSGEIGFFRAQASQPAHI